VNANHETIRIVRSWLREDGHEDADRVLWNVLGQIATIPQRRPGWLARRFPFMANTTIRYGIAAAIVLVALGFGAVLLTRRVAAPPTPTAVPTPLALASGTFPAGFGMGTVIQIDATGGGTTVSGQMDVSQDTGKFSVALRCVRHIGTDIRLIGGEVTDSTYHEAPQGSRVAIALERGTPVMAILWFEDKPAAASCSAFLEGVPSPLNNLQPVSGEVRIAW
jgi:hypothetical protein